MQVMHVHCGAANGNQIRADMTPIDKPKTAVKADRRYKAATCLALCLTMVSGNSIPEHGHQGVLTPGDRPVKHSCEPASKKIAKIVKHSCKPCNYFTKCNI